MAEQEVENEKNPLEDLVQYSLNQDFNNANKVFNDVISVKLNDVLDQEKIKLANQIYNNTEIGDQEEEEDEDQLELDLEDENDNSEESEEKEMADEMDETDPEESGEVQSSVQEPSDHVEEPMGDEDDEQEESEN